MTKFHIRTPFLRATISGVFQMNKERDDFFDEQSGNDQASDQLLKMIEQYDKKVRTDITPD